MRRVLKGALSGAIGFEILTTAGSGLLVKSATHNPVYGVFAVVVGLLIWINYLSRFTLYVAAWTVTAPFDADVRPSGTSVPEIAELAGISPADVEDFAGERPAGFFGLGVMAAGTVDVAWSGLKAARDVVRRE
jgi:membrane protein